MTISSDEGAQAKGERARRWQHRLRHSRRALGLMFFASLLESTVLPIPLEVVLIPFMLANRHRIWWVATVVLAGCLAGAGLGYGLGFLFFETAGRWLISLMDWQQVYASYQQEFEAHGFWAVVAVGVTPVPFQVAMLAAGAAKYPFAWFILAAVIARGLRYYGLALLVVLLGRRALLLWERHSRAVALAITLLALAGIAYAIWSTPS